MKKTILLTVLFVLCTACSRSDVEDAVKQDRSITRIRATIAANRTRVTLGLNPLTSDQAYWKAGDFLFVSELSEGTSQFTGHVLKYDYVIPTPEVNQSKGYFSGTGMVTGGKYLILNTNIPSAFIELPQLGESSFACTFKSTFYCAASFGVNPDDVQQIADELLFIGTVVVPDTNEEPTISLSSPMSMIELRITSGVSSGLVEQIAIESADNVFSYKICTDNKGECQSAGMLNNYNWQKLDSKAIFTVGHEPKLDATTPLKVRILAFQKENTTTSLTVTATMVNGSTFAYTTNRQTRTLPPNAITVIDADLK